MSSPLGTLIDDEVGRAESDIAAKRTRAQSVLTASGALVTLLTGLLAVAVSQDAGLHFTSLSKTLAGTALFAFVAATVCVLFLYMPAPAVAAKEDDLARLARDDWGDETFDRDVAMFLVDYLRSLRGVNESLSRFLRAAITCEVLGVALTAVLAMTLLAQSST